MAEKDARPAAPRDWPLTLSTAQVAELLGVPLATLRRNIVKLRRDEGFPQPLLGLGRRYDRIAIEQWLARKRAIDSGQPHTPPLDDIEAWQRELDRRAAEGLGSPRRVKKERLLDPAQEVARLQRLRDTEPDSFTTAPRKPRTRGGT